MPIQQTIYKFENFNVSTYLVFKYKVLSNIDFSVQLESCIGNTEFQIFKSTQDMMDNKPLTRSGGLMNGVREARVKGDKGDYLIVVSPIGSERMRFRPFTF